MTTLKNKLTASVRQAQVASQVSTAAEPATKASKSFTDRVTEPKAIKASPKAVSSAPAAHPFVDVTESGTSLFPQRVWPD
jgi:hypothetical protein